MYKITRWLTFLVAAVSLPCLGASEIDYDQDGEVNNADLAKAAQNPICQHDQPAVAEQHQFQVRALSNIEKREFSADWTFTFDAIPAAQVVGINFPA